MSFHDVNLPRHIEVFAIGSSEFSTSCAVSMSGREVRSLDAASPKRRYTLKDCRLSALQFEAFNSFFKARGGRRFSFRLRDHFDYIAARQIIAIGDGSAIEFQLQKTYEDKVNPYVRTITKPIAASVNLWSDMEDIIPNSIDANTGIVRLAQPLAGGASLSASFEFDVPVRFACDEFQYSLSKDGSIILNDVELIEVYE